MGQRVRRFERKRSPKVLLSLRKLLFGKKHHPAKALTVMILGVQPERFAQNPLGVLVTKQSEVGNSQEEDGPVICGVEGERALDVFLRPLEVAGDEVADRNAVGDIRQFGTEALGLFEDIEIRLLAAILMVKAPEGQ